MIDDLPKGLGPVMPALLAAARAESARLRTEPATPRRRRRSSSWAMLNAKARAEGWSYPSQKYRARAHGITDPAVWREHVAASRPGPGRQQRFPLAPIMFHGDFTTLRDLARWAGYSHAAVSTWQYRGGVTADVADELATRLDLHPSLLWPDYPTPDPDEIPDDIAELLPTRVLQDA